MEQRANFLALTLLDALEDENESDIFSMLDRNTINSSVVPCERGLAPLHYVCGMQNEELALKILQRFLESDQVDANVCCDGNMTALHIAAIYGRVELVRLLLEHGARPDLIDDEHKMPMHYAIEECHFEVLQLLSDHILKEKQAKQEKQLKQSLKTPKSMIKYNHDVTSPYYINITHRRNKPQPSFPDEMELEHSVNLFALTRDHLEELSNREKPSSGRRTLIESWRDKVERSRVRKSMLQEEHVEALVDQAMTQDDFDYEQHVQQTLRESDQERERDQDQAASQQQTASEAGRAAFGQLVEQVAQACVLEQSYHTAQDEIQTPKKEDYYLQMTEAYVHTDDENGLVFYETKLLQNAVKSVPSKRREKQEHLKVPSPPQLDSSVSTNLTLPLDYETDALRAELTQLGAPVGPITRTTKRLYIKQLIKYKRNTEALLAAQKHAKAAQIKYSVELHHTLRSQPDFDHIANEYMKYEIQSAAHFATASTTTNGRQMREGHLKQSFIYMLIDPRISRNLPGERNFLDPLCIWSRFLDAIFYVGKGKSSRPYAHLYDAMRQHTRAHQQQHNPAEKRGKAKRCLLMPELFKSPPPAGSGPAGSRKLQRILDIWQHGSGVVCLHVFHNILPTDAYTREASIIDALGLTHLTNLKRGDYYGPAQIWTMKHKKQLGIALLHKAMHIYLAEGESQLSPSDLI
ncbi:uncharacterized protein LOC117780010 [Drosophila innubila]|uniref:uncharacterized protein LOC117780010 n=1 Tax=Drosophila innubila TaxID=198719 RepID=UPI00148B76C2|nr:uncharacterized protein LOC117780010 [Drosophila innubila]